MEISTCSRKCLRQGFLRAVSSDKNVAEYRGGYVLGRGLGECKIYIKNQSGSVSRELKVSVKKSKKFW